MEAGAVHPQHPPLKPKRGDLVLIHWVDITNDGAGSPDAAALTPRITAGFFHGYRKQKGVRVLVTYLTQDCDEGRAQFGSDIYPVSVVRHVEVVKRANEIAFKE